jgi:hypothetical protein
VEEEHCRGLDHGPCRSHEAALLQAGGSTCKKSPQVDLTGLRSGG